MPSDFGVKGFFGPWYFRIGKSFDRSEDSSVLVVCALYELENSPVSKSNSSLSEAISKHSLIFLP